MKSNISIILFIFYLIVLITTIIIPLLAVIKTTDMTTDRVKDYVSDDNTECFDYLYSIKAESSIFSYSCLITAFATLIIFFLLFLLRWTGCLKISDGMIFVIILFTYVIICLVAYKVFGCFLARSICGNSCSNKKSNLNISKNNIYNK